MRTSTFQPPATGMDCGLDRTDWAGPEIGDAAVGIDGVLVGVATGREAIPGAAKASSISSSPQTSVLSSTMMSSGMWTAK